MICRSRSVDNNNASFSSASLAMMHSQSYLLGVTGNNYCMDLRQIELRAKEALDRASATIFVPRSSLPNYIDFRQILHDMRERVAES